MVDFLENYFFVQKHLYSTLSKVSDGMCEENGKNYIDFDSFPSFISISSIATTDTLLLNKEKKYIVFVEFKNLSKVRDFNRWFNRNRKQQIYLKAYESFLSLGELVVQKGFNYDHYYNLDKRFIVVYDTKDSKKKIHHHIKGKIKRFGFIFNDKVYVQRCEGFKKFLGEKGL